MAPLSLQLHHHLLSRVKINLMSTLIPNTLTMPSIWSDLKNKSDPSFLFPSLGQSNASNDPHKIFLIREILEKIISYVSLLDLSAASQVCKSWSILATPRLYRHLCFHGIESSHTIIKFVKAMDWNASNFSSLGSSLVFYGDKLQFALRQTSRDMKKAELHSITALFQYFKNLYSHSPKRKECQICRHSRLLADKSPVKELLVPVFLGKHSHRFQGAVYGVVSLKSRKKFKDQPQVKALEKTAPCLQVHIHPFISDWTTVKSRLYQTNGPFLRSLTISSVRSFN
jgi:hypothetical protein